MNNIEHCRLTLDAQEIRTLLRIKFDSTDEIHVKLAPQSSMCFVSGNGITYLMKREDSPRYGFKIKVKAETEEDYSAFEKRQNSEMSKFILLDNSYHSDPAKNKEAHQIIERTNNLTKYGNKD